MCVSVQKSLSFSSACSLLSLCHAQTHTLSCFSSLVSLHSLSLSLSLSLPPSHTHSLTHIFFLSLARSFSVALTRWLFSCPFSHGRFGSLMHPLLLTTPCTPSLDNTIARDGDRVKLCYSSRKPTPPCAEFTVRTMLVPLI